MDQFVKNINPWMDFCSHLFFPHKWTHLALSSRQGQEDRLQLVHLHVTVQFSLDLVFLFRPKKGIPHFETKRNRIKWNKRIFNVCHAVSVEENSFDMWQKSGGRLHYDLSDEKLNNSTRRSLKFSKLPFFLMIFIKNCSASLVSISDNKIFLMRCRESCFHCTYFTGYITAGHTVKYR